MGTEPEKPPALSEEEELMSKELADEGVFSQEQSARLARVIENALQRRDKRIFQKIETRWSYHKARLKDQKK